MHSRVDVLCPWCRPSPMACGYIHPTLLARPGVQTRPPHPTRACHGNANADPGGFSWPARCARRRRPPAHLLRRRRLRHRRRGGVHPKLRWSVRRSVRRLIRWCVWWSIRRPIRRCVRRLRRLRPAAVAAAGPAAGVDAVIRLPAPLLGCSCGAGGCCSGRQCARPWGRGGRWGRAREVSSNVAGMGLWRLVYTAAPPAPLHQHQLGGGGGVSSVTRRNSRHPCAPTAHY